LEPRQASQLSGEVTELFLVGTHPDYSRT
jgi:hypothetical protein